MTLRHLEIFSAVYHQESITKAADLLNMAQPAVSKSIKELESYYSVKLFERMNRKLYITDAGKSLIEYTDSVLNQLNEAKEILQDVSTLSKIRIGSNISFGINHLPDLLSGFQMIHPEIPVTAMINNSSNIETALNQNQLDFAIIDKPSGSPHVNSTYLLSEKMTIVCSPSFPYISLLNNNSDNLQYKISLKSLCSFPLLLREPGSGSRKIVDDLFLNTHVPGNIIVESTSTQSLIEFCLRGLGLLIVPEHTVKKYIESGALLELHPDTDVLVRNYYLIYHKNKFFTKSMKYLYKHLVK